MKVKWQSDAPNMELKVPSEIELGGYIPTDEELTFKNCKAQYLFAEMPDNDVFNRLLIVAGETE